MQQFLRPLVDNKKAEQGGISYATVYCNIQAQIGNYKKQILYKNIGRVYIETSRFLFITLPGFPVVE